MTGRICRYQAGQDRDRVCPGLDTGKRCIEFIVRDNQ